MNLLVEGICPNTTCTFFDRDAPVTVDVRELPNGWGQFQGEFGVCDECKSPVFVQFDLEQGDFDE